MSGKLMIIGAHPDDCEISGGLAVLWMRQGGQVKFLSLTNGNAGHHLQSGQELARRRYQETRRVAERFGIEYEVFDCDDGYLTDSLENRDRLIASVRAFDPDVIVGPRPNDYHTDHRHASLLIQDASFLLRVPNVCPSAAAMTKTPVILYKYDEFMIPSPFVPDLVFDIDSAREQKGLMWYYHASQSFEWLPWIGRYEDQVPQGDEERLRWITDHTAGRCRGAARRYRNRLIDKYGPERGDRVEAAEAYQFCEYGRRPGVEEIRTMFPF